MKKLILFILIISLTAITSINAFAADDITIQKGDPTDSLGEDYSVINHNFTNFAEFEIVSFSVSNGTAINNGVITLNYGLSIVPVEGSRSEFINNNTLSIGSAVMGGAFNVPGGTYFTNNGVVYLSNMTECDLSGTISGDGYFVCDSTVDASLVEELKSVSTNRVLTADEYQSLMGENSSSIRDESANVKATYTPGTPESTVYKVDITWGSLEFTYTDSSKGTWNTDTHKYDGAQEGKWSWAEGANKITLTNHSNAEVTVTASYTAASGYDAIGLTFDRATITLATADNGVNGAAGTPTSDSISFTPRGELQKSESKVTIGTITITIS